MPSQGKFSPVITGQQIELESCSNLLMTRGVVYFRIKKVLLRFGFGVLGPWDHDWGMFFGYFYDVFMRSYPPIFWLEIFLDSRLEYESLEPLVEFLAFLLQKLCQKIPNISGIP